MAQSAPPPHRRLRPLWLVAGTALALGTAGLVAAALRGPASGGPVAAVNPATAPARAQPPLAQVQRIHDALHDIDARCRPAPRAADRRRLQRDADAILAFARRYPDATFAIDEETGRTLTLLVLARQGLRSCVPATADRIEGALPPDLRGLPAPAP